MKINSATSIWGTVSLISLIFLGSAHSQSLNIAVSSVQYSTTVSYQYYPDAGGATASRTTTSPSPISDEFISLDPFFGGFNNVAMASNSLFGMQVHTDAPGKDSGFDASSSIQMTFLPLVDQNQTINIQFINTANIEFTSGAVSLLDLSSNTELLDYVWPSSINEPFGNVPFINDGSGNFNANLNVDISFLASDEYELIMQTSSNANGDDEFSQIQLSGLQPVPEPSSASLMVLALLVLPIMRRIAAR